ncbi:MAG TPA: DUF4331 domain-containing protein [Terriglobia bacterium]|nr:DUF4331 domain-containing protein [Terriglobia bacterium]
MMKTKISLVTLTLALLTITAATVLLVRPAGIMASSHREAPITALDPMADITDLWAFRSYDASGNDTNPASVTIIMGVNPFEEPANGPNWFPFGPEILYSINIDNNNSGTGDIVFQFRFSSQYQLPTVPNGLAGFTSGSGGTAPGIPPQITNFANPGLNLRQSYTVTMIKNGVPTPIVNSDGAPFWAVPANAGPRTMNYADLYAAGTYTNTNNGVSVFAGTVDDPFFIDLGAAFDTANFRLLAGGTGVPGVLSASQDAANENFAPDTVSGYAVDVIALQVPIWMLTSTGNVEAATSPNATIGVWGTTGRPVITVRHNAAVTGSPDTNFGAFSQVQRLGNPLINELIIGIGSKDFWSLSAPVNDAQFAGWDLNPVIVTIVDSLYSVLAPGALYSPPAPRYDLLPLVEYLPPIAAPGTTAGPIADLLRLNTGVAPTAPGGANRLGLLAGDGAGYPNGRRLADDVVDITLRVAVGGVLAGNMCGPSNTTSCNVFPNNALGDGVNVNDVDSDLATDGITNLVEPNTHFHTSFPYVDYCPSGRNRRHIDPGEPGCTAGVGPPCPIE